MGKAIVASRLFVSTLAIASAFAAASASAQQSADRSETQPDDGTIVVTANKRSENVQQVPLAVSVVAPSALADANVTEFADLGRVAPSLRIAQAQQPLNSNISMRGVGTFALSIGVESSVAVLVDDVPYATQARAFTSLPDVERIEVLRGPQSTLYGKSASAGLINLITRNPTRSVEGQANLMATTDEEYNANFYVSGPMSETLGFVVSGAYSTWDGNLYNTVLDESQGARSSANFRGKLRWEPSATASLTATVNYNEGDTRSGSLPVVRADAGAAYFGIPTLPIATVLPGTGFTTDNTLVADNFASGVDYHGIGGNLRGVFDIGGVTLTSITSYDKYNQHDFTDQDGTSSPSFGDNTEDGRFESRLFTQELRLQSDGDEPLSYTVGLYYAKADFNRPFQRGPQFALAHWNATSGSRQLAGYVQADWNFVEPLTLTAGARIQRESVNYTFLDIQNGDAYFSGDSSDTAGTYRVSLRYDITPDLNIFATHSTGRKGETYDLTTGFNQTRADAGPVKPEKAESFEFGVRSQWFDRMLTANLTFFNVDYTDLQAQSIESFGNPPTNNFRLTNVGGLRTRGMEFDFALRPDNDFTLTVSGTYLDAIYTSYETARCYTGQTAAQGCTGTPGRQNLTGERLGNPMWSLVSSASYRPEITSSLRADLGVVWQYDSHNFVQDPVAYLGNRNIVNVRAGIESIDGWKLTAFVNNLFNRRNFSGFNNRSNFFGGFTVVQAALARDYERYAGVRLSYDF